MLKDQSCNNCRPNQHSGSFFFLICDDRYCCWGKPFWWFEGSLLLHPQGDLKQTFSKIYTFLFPGHIACHCWHVCDLHVLWSSGVLGSFIILVDLFLFQTGFVFANQASGVKEEYLFFHNKSGLNSIQCDPTNPPDICPFNLPKWVDCSDEANALRDKYKKFFEVRTSRWSIIFNMSLDNYIYSSEKSGRPVASGRQLDRIRRSLRQLGHRGDRQ